MEKKYEQLGGQIIFRLRSKLNALRSIERIITTNEQDFFEAYNNDPVSVEKAIVNFNVKELKRLLLRNLDISKWPLRELRREAFKLNIFGWSRLAKNNLIKEIVNERSKISNKGK